MLISKAFRYLADRQFQFVRIPNESSIYTKVSYGVPQGSVLQLFSFVHAAQSTIIRKHGINLHWYADDTQLYLSMKPDEITHIPKIEACLNHIKAWMTNNFLLINTD